MLFYYTGTGSSLAVSKRINSGLEECSRHSMSSYNPENFITEKCERVGFIIPNYYSTIPRPVRLFIEKMDLSKVKYCFGISNAGGSLGKVLVHLAELVESRGARLNYSACLNHGSNYIVASYYDRFNLRGEKLQQNLEKNNKKIAAIVKDIIDGKEVRPEKNSFEYFMTRLIYNSKLTDNRRNFSDLFSVTSDCSGCSICVKVCPAQNITMGEDNRPVWGNNCDDCCGCLHACPSKSIMFNGEVLDKKRYCHPETSVKEIISEMKI